VYLIATLANDADYMPALTHALSKELPNLDPRDESWGIGYFTDDRALIIQRPIDRKEPVDVHRVTSDLRSQVLLACAGVREPSPLRSRRWLFAAVGDLSPLEALSGTIRDKLPDFARTELGDDSGPELAFGMFLAELRRRGILDDPLLGAESLREAGSRVADAIRGLASEVEDRELNAAFVATNGRLVLGCALGRPLHLKLQAGLEGLPEGPVDPARTDFKQVAASLKRFRAVVLAHEPGEQSDWSALPEDAVVVVDGQLNTFGPTGR